MGAAAVHGRSFSTMAEHDHEEDEVPFVRKKKIHVNAATVRYNILCLPFSAMLLIILCDLQLVDLKAALYRKQQEFKREKVSQARSNDGLPVTKVTDKVW